MYNVQIRKMVSDDYNNVYSLWTSCAGMGLNNLDDSQQGIENFLNRNPDTCFVAEDKNQIIGTIIVGNDGRRGYIYHTAVGLEYRNKGIGSQLVANAIKALKNQGINKAALVVFAKNENGNAFWEKQGFTVREDIIYRNKSLKEIIRIDT